MHTFRFWSSSAISIKRNITNKIPKNGSDPCAMLCFDKKTPAKANKKPVKYVNKKLESLLKDACIQISVFKCYACDIKCCTTFIDIQSECSRLCVPAKTG